MSCEREANRKACRAHSCVCRVYVWVCVESTIRSQQNAFHFILSTSYGLLTVVDCKWLIEWMLHQNSLSHSIKKEREREKKQCEHEDEEKYNTYWISTKSEHKTVSMISKCDVKIAHFHFPRMCRVFFRCFVFSLTSFLPLIGSKAFLEMANSQKRRKKKTTNDWLALIEKLSFSVFLSRMENERKIMRWIDITASYYCQSFSSFIKHQNTGTRENMKRCESK